MASPIEQSKKEKERFIKLSKALKNNLQRRKINNKVS